jgi:thioredoxin reductase (NADPH)
MHDLIIIGAGPAGLTAALYAGRSRLKTLLLEKMAVGGRILMSEAIENFPGFPGGISTPDLIQRMKEQVDELGIEIIAEEVSDIDCVNKLVKAGGKEYTAKAIIIATGAKPRRLNVPGEERLTGRGISYCATCDAPFFKDKNVVVVGGGDAVAEEALYLARFAREVIIVHRRDDLRASVILQERLQENKKINFILSSVIVEITGSARVEAVKVKDLKTGKEKKVDCDGVFIFIGYDPDTQVFKNKLQLDESGFIMTSDTLAASEEGVFACGDCRKKSLYQVITACADGAVAADSAYKYIVAKR